MDIHAQWGEIPKVSESEKVKEREPIKLHALDVEGPRLHQPSSRHQPPTNDLLPTEWFESDPVVIHTIKLVQHTKKLRQMIHTIQQQQLESSTDPEISYPAAPPIPEYRGPALKYRRMGHIPFLLKDYENDFVRGVGEIPPVIDETACRKLLKKSTATICAHLGFDSSSEVTIDTLADVLHEYFQELCKHLRMEQDNTLLTGCSGFPDIVEKTFHDMGIGSITSLNDFYQTRVLDYNVNMENTCQNLMSEYEKLIQPSLIKQQDPDNVPVIRIKEEPSSEIQFPVLDENDELNDAEQLLQLEGLGGFEITVEHESASGLTTEVESKWSKEGVKPEAAESSVSSTRVSTLDDFDDPGSTKERPPNTPAQLSEGGDSIQDPGSVTEIMSPPSIPRSSKSKKRKKMKRSQVLRKDTVFVMENPRHPCSELTNNGMMSNYWLYRR